MCQSEVARLKLQIELEYEAMMRGLSGLAQGAASHAFINARLKRVDSYQGELVKHVGEAEATQIIYELYDEIVK